MRQLSELAESQSALIQNLTKGMNQIIVGQSHLVESLLVPLLADGHVLLEGVPGLAKTLAIKTLASLVNADFNRIQFTPDLLPADVVGTLVYSQRSETFSVKHGPIFAHFVLADEINRAPAKVQSALLEAMQEHQVTIGENTMPLPNPFFVMATQNPIDQEGTYALPEAQTDRFMLKILVDYPTLEEERAIARRHLDGSIAAPVQPITDVAHILAARDAVKQIYVDERITQYAADLVRATRFPAEYGQAALEPMISCGASPRATINLVLAARALALIRQRGYVVPEDVRDMAPEVLRHRVALTYEAEAEQMTADDVVAQIIAAVPLP